MLLLVVVEQVVLVQQTHLQLQAVLVALVMMLQTLLAVVLRLVAVAVEVAVNQLQVLGVAVVEMVQPQETQATEQ
jgi:hypothetical protein